MRNFFLMVFGLSVGVLFASGSVEAQVAFSGANANSMTETNTRGSQDLSFDPTELLAAVNPAPGADKCFTCVNTTSEAGGTTAGALTNSMFGEIRANDDADLGKQSTRPEDQDRSIPTGSTCGNDCNDSTDFTFSMPLPTLNFLSAGNAVPTTNPTVSEPVGRGGMKNTFSNDFEYFEDGTSTFAQMVGQTTFTEGVGGDEVQIVSFEAHSDNPALADVGFFGGHIFWSQSINEGAFDLATNGDFRYNSSGFPEASAPTGLGQSVGSNEQEIGGGGGR